MLKFVSCVLITSFVLSSCWTSPKTVTKSSNSGTVSPVEKVVPREIVPPTSPKDVLPTPPIPATPAN